MGLPGMVECPKTPPAVEALIERVAEALRSLADDVLTAIGASSSLATEVLGSAARKVDRERVAQRGYEQQRDDISRELGQFRDRLAAVEAELKAAGADRSADDWVRERRIDKVREERSQLLARIAGHEQALRGDA